MCPQRDQQLAGLCADAEGVVHGDQQFAWSCIAVSIIDEDAGVQRDQQLAGLTVLDKGACP